MRVNELQGMGDTIADLHLSLVAADVKSIYLPRDITTFLEEAVWSALAGLVNGPQI